MLVKDGNFEGVQAPTIRRIKKSGTDMTPNINMLVTLGDNVTLTIDGNSIELLKNFTLVMLKGVKYEFSDDIALGIA